MQWEGRSLGFYPWEGATALLGAPPHTRLCLWLARGTRGRDGLQAGSPPHTPSSSTPDATAPSPERTCVSRYKRSCGRCGAHHTRLVDQRKTNSGSSGGSNQPSGSPFLEGPLRAQWTGGLRERGQESVPCLARQSSRASAGQIASGLCHSVKGRSGHQVGLPLLHFMARRLGSVGPAALSRQSHPELIPAARATCSDSRPATHQRPRPGQLTHWVLCFSALRSSSRGIRSARQPQHTPGGLPELQCTGGADRIPGAA